ncbi:hypothetical protein [[Clostridium] innocuum]|uniref:hypothetical protein n=1 Tax=Clostridium innocuum TaxID=1522 RepID=UPI001C38700F|nr:hypothetical protein [[Clostridium] innocuum]MBV4171321.1 hypothetical protein [[Clostridium] innocuum]
MFKKVCVILTSLCLLTACNVNEDLVKDQEAKTKDEKTSEVSKNTTSKVSEEKKEKESSKSSDGSSSKKETPKQNEAPAQKKEASSASNKETSNTTVVTKSESAPAKEETPKPSGNSSVSAPPENEVTQTQPQPAPSAPSTPPAACPGGFDPSLPCDFISDGNVYFATFQSESEAFAQGQYYLDQVMYIGQQEITNYSVQPVYRNDQAIAYYGLNLWSNGVMIY